MRTNPDHELLSLSLVPVVWDTKHNTIVSNESSEIIRFLNTVSPPFLA
jgi:glutathionyl-hydroquinone reductase